MAFFYNKTLRKIVLALITVWSIGSFWFLNDVKTINVILSLVGIALIYLIIFGLGELFIVIILSFTASFALYGFLFMFNLPTWLIMLANFLIFLYLFAYFDQIRGLFKRERPIFVVLFGLIISGTFLLLSYLLISPFNRSAIIMITTYGLIGFCLEVVEKKSPKKYIRYIYYIGICFVLLLLTAVWGGN